MSDGATVAGGQEPTATPAQGAPAAAAATPPKAEGDPKPLMGDGALGEGKLAEGEPKPLMGEEKPGEGGKPAEGEPEPEKVDYFADAKLPEGYVLDQELAPKAAELFGKYKLPKEAAQEFIDFAASMRTREAQESARAAESSRVESIRRMQAEITSRPEYEKEKALVRLGIDNLAKDNPKIRAFYNDPVFGSMPELWDIALAVGRRFEQEGQLLNGGKDSGAGKSFLEGLYPEMNKELNERK